MFCDRADAGRQLAERLEYLRGQPSVVLGIARGGVPVGFEVATAIGAPLDVIVVRKLGAPFQPELAVGAIGEDGVRVLNDSVVRLSVVAEDELAAIEVRERAELERRSRRYRAGRRRLPLDRLTAVVVDDGMATGATARAACQVARARGAARVVLAVPVAPPGWEALIGTDADEFACATTPEALFSIGQVYEDFSPVTDDEVVRYLCRAALRPPVPTADASIPEASPARDEEVDVQAGPVRLSGHLTLPAHPRGVVVFAHGSGSSRHSPRNRYVAGVLNRAGMGTLLFDLLSMEEEADRANVFDIGLLGRRLVQVTKWLRAQPGIMGLPIGYFGASTGAGAALCAAAEQDAHIAAVVSRGGRPDLAGDRLADVTAPTLLIVGGRDEMVLQLNREAQAELRCESRVVIVPGATHLFEEPGTLEKVAEVARDWFIVNLAPSPDAPV